ncbi:uncharacterized protein SPPG_09172 [Spizellomyces punctatus DAOM BR117]|uniref:Uncharacterized protein n=1 Tax=Spizellomyces punctatus (strain DAOM BR117) TaxID=645134 RepID=A0A0L0HJB2_SPIPD|nr:uncharacterized protein SPPG_09172 [Spizellomyces punctatus DAOM BR117]KND00985.1 hypothetical protein SPPG_09172 [Spizellomyces punctatus DAOM BR117]|eukprot:XP_016609024.1 hypothetical protein SPPG_09172 [Spizellomyces punctatus DAOM BR117]
MQDAIILEFSKWGFQLDDPPPNPPRLEQASLPQAVSPRDHLGADQDDQVLDQGEAVAAGSSDSCLEEVEEGARPDEVDADILVERKTQEALVVLRGRPEEVLEDPVLDLAETYG